jgi:hypothetical protein
MSTMLTERRMKEVQSAKVVDVILRFRDHSECAIFAVTNLGKHKMILGYPWLRNHNPEVNWRTQEVTLSRCPAQCHTCRAKVRKERREAAQIHAYRMGPLPQMVEEEEEEEEEEEPESVDFGPLLGPGEHLFATVSTPTVPTEVITASTTTAQQLAKKALQSVPMKEKELIPPYLRDFEDVFAKESFDSLPEQRTWDHAIKLELGAKPSACKVYPLAPSKQLQLEEFLRENLGTGRIRPSKSPMASPVFFIKKKDRTLCLA